MKADANRKPNEPGLAEHDRSRSTLEHYSVRKQWITGLSFFLSSGAAATIIAKAPSIIPIFLSVVPALLSAYSIAVGLDKKSASMVKLHTAWNKLQSDYEHLWNHWFDEQAETEFLDLVRRGHDASELGTEAPWDENLIAKWQDRVNAQYEQASTAA